MFLCVFDGNNVDQGVYSDLVGLSQVLIKGEGKMGHWYEPVLGLAGQLRGWLGFWANVVFG